MKEWNTKHTKGLTFIKEWDTKHTQGFTFMKEWDTKHTKGFTFMKEWIACTTLSNPDTALILTTASFSRSLIAKQVEKIKIVLVHFSLKRQHPPSRLTPKEKKERQTESKNKQKPQQNTNTFVLFPSKG